MVAKVCFLQLPTKKEQGQNQPNQKQQKPEQPNKGTDTGPKRHLETKDLNLPAALKDVPQIPRLWLSEPWKSPRAVDPGELLPRARKKGRFCASGNLDLLWLKWDPVL